LLARLPQLRLLITTGESNPSIDAPAARDLGITVCGTRYLDHPTSELTWGLILSLLRRIPVENLSTHTNGPWQSTVGVDLHGKTLGILGLGAVGSRVARVGVAFDMRVIAWSNNLTPERCAEHQVQYVPKSVLLHDADVLSIHTNLSARTIGLIKHEELCAMKRTAYLVNTSRGQIVDEAALIDALRRGIIAGAALDVFDCEPLTPDHPFRQLDNVVLTPHLGYVTEDNYRLFYRDVVEDVEAWLTGNPTRELHTLRQVNRAL